MMETIKIGKEEETLISEINNLKESYRTRMEGVCLGAKLVRQQIPDSENEAISKIVTEMDRTIKCMEVLAHIIQSIEFSEEFDEEKFSIRWSVYNDRGTGYYNDYAYGVPHTGKPVTERQFMFAISSWEREVCKWLALVNEKSGTIFESIRADIEPRIYGMLYTYSVEYSLDRFNKP